MQINRETDKYTDSEECQVGDRKDCLRFNIFILQDINFNSS